MSKYKISLYKCPANFPFLFAVHTWFVISKDGVSDRYEVAFPKYIQDGKKTYFYKNFIKPYSGINIFPFWHRFFWGSTHVGTIDGEEGSLAEEMYAYIVNTKETYPFKNEYFLLGPNSNTYTSFIVKKFPNFPCKLPWNAVGKSFIS